MGRNKKQPRYLRGAVESSKARTPKAIAHLVADDGAHQRPVFSFALADTAYQGEWGWNLLDEPAAKRLVEFVLQISGSTWPDIWSMTGAGTQQQHRLHHNQEISTICDVAQQRLASTERYAEMGGDLFRFHIEDRERLWGYHHRGMFYVLWWDPDHKVYPVDYFDLKKSVR